MEEIQCMQRSARRDHQRDPLTQKNPLQMLQGVLI